MESAPMLANSSTTTPSRSMTSSDSSPASTLAMRFFSSSMRFHRTLSALSTASTAGVLSATTSCSTYKKSMRGGSIRSREAIILRRVDLPRPLAPTNPYRRPWAMLSAASLNKIFPAAEMLKLGTLMSSEFCHWGSFSLTAVCEQANCAPSRLAFAATFSYSAARAAASRSFINRFRSLLLSFFPFLPYNSLFGSSSSAFSASRIALLLSDQTTSSGAPYMTSSSAAFSVAFGISWATGLGCAGAFFGAGADSSASPSSFFFMAASICISNLDFLAAAFSAAFVSSSSSLLFFSFLSFLDFFPFFSFFSFLSFFFFFLEGSRIVKAICSTSSSSSSSSSSSLSLSSSIIMANCAKRPPFFLFLLFFRDGWGM
mmetsp:Transcript_116515/g.238303  ORF Transcript_116515/g.238303 Transcript_116515/m.238303 type:complete len:372 (-) Transcript_116515:678-1793(-)